MIDTLTSFQYELREMYHIYREIELNQNVDSVTRDIGSVIDSVRAHLDSNVHHLFGSGLGLGLKVRVRVEG